MHLTPCTVRITGAFAFLAILPPATAQSGAAPAAEGDVVRLMTYTVSAEGESGYYSASALSGTRTQTALKDLAMTVNVVTSELISDIGAIKLEEALLYTPGVSKASDFEG